MDKEVADFKGHNGQKPHKYSEIMEYALDVVALANAGHDISGEYIRPANSNEKLNNILYQMLIYRMIKKFGPLNNNNKFF